MPDKKYPEEIRTEMAERVFRQSVIKNLDAGIEQLEANLEQLITNSNAMIASVRLLKDESMKLIMPLRKMQEAIWRLNDPE
uniref:Uncharacterized protein n=1 Tax=viral metagenome TaxID=1070528 RepID=A0A6M3JVY9_9ZZZZ